MSTKLSVVVPLPEGAKVHLKGSQLTVEGPLGKVTRKFPASSIALETKGKQIHLTLNLPERRESRSLIMTWERHVANLTAGVTRGVEAKAKVVAAHFPMKVYVKDNYVMIENFLGEKYPRRSPLMGATKAEVAGEELLFNGVDVEQVGQTVANLERATHIRNYDPRVFQDGIYVTIKAHLKEVQ